MLDIKGRAIKLGDHINTDYIISGKYKFKTQDMSTLAKHAFEDLDPTLVSRIRPGDILVAGVNFGCGSSREHAPRERKGLWEEVRRELLEEAEKKVREHDSKGIKGPDLLVSVYGPVLGRFADYSMVKDAAGNIKTPSDALEVVAEAVNRFLTEDIQGADVETLAYLNLLRNFPNLIVEYDLARITTVFGGNVSLDLLDVRGGSGLVRKEKGKVGILLSKERLANGIIIPTKPEKLKTLSETTTHSVIGVQVY